jgi:hypothetical protein
MITTKYILYGTANSTTGWLFTKTHLSKFIQQSTHSPTWICLDIRNPLGRLISQWLLIRKCKQYFSNNWIIPRFKSRKFPCAKKGLSSLYKEDFYFVDRIHDSALHGNWCTASYEEHANFADKSACLMANNIWNEVVTIHRSQKVFKTLSLCIWIFFAINRFVKKHRCNIPFCTYSTPDTNFH